MLTAGQSFIEMLSGFNEDTNYEDSISFPDILNLPQTPSISLPDGYLDIPNLTKRESSEEDEENDKNSITNNSPPKNGLENDKKLTEKEKHKVRQRVRRNKINTTLDRLKTMVPQCVERESEINAPGKKKKVDQTQLLELTVDYIQQLKDAMAELQKENQILRSYIDKNSPNSSPGTYSGSSPPKCVVSPNSSPFNRLSPHSPDIDLQILTNELQSQQNTQKHQGMVQNYFNSHQNSSNSPPKSNGIPSPSRHRIFNKKQSSTNRRCKTCRLMLCRPSKNQISTIPTLVA